MNQNSIKEAKSTLLTSKREKIAFWGTVLLLNTMYLLLVMSLLSQYYTLQNARISVEILNPVLPLVIIYILFALYFLSIESKNYKSLMRATLALLLGILGVYNIFVLKMNLQEKEGKIYALQQQCITLSHQYDVLVKKMQ